LDGERKLREVGKRFQVAGLDACGVELRSVVRNVVVRASERPAQTFELKRSELVTAHRLDQLEITGSGTFRSHGRPRSHTAAGRKRAALDEGAVVSDRVVPWRKDRDDSRNAKLKYDIRVRYRIAVGQDACVPAARRNDIERSFIVGQYGTRDRHLHHAAGRCS